VLDKGAALASPADFPNLVPSSPVSHASIYWGLGGPAIATPDLNATAESAIATGVELVEAGACPSAVAGSVEELSQLSERVLAPLLGMRSMAAHSEGASAVVLEAEDVARARSAEPLAAITYARARRTDHGRPDAGFVDLPTPSQGALVVTEPGVDAAALLAGTPWAAVPHVTTNALAGDHVGLGGIAFAGAAASIAAGRAPSILVLGHAPERSYAFVLERAPRQTEGLTSSEARG
jgi:3-oxoacyl-[acyl-carrier-protein] synthase II